MPDLINGRFFSLPGVQPVRGVEYQAVLDPHIFVSMHNSRRNKDHGRRVETGIENLPDTARRRAGPSVPEVYLEVGGTEETEIICLVHMLMGSPGNTGQSHGKVRHCGLHHAVKFILPEQLRQPAALIEKLGKRPHHNVVYSSFPECHD
jgi:hypothetical protein